MARVEVGSRVEVDRPGFWTPREAEYAWELGRRVCESHPPHSKGQDLASVRSLPRSQWAADHDSVPECRGSESECHATAGKAQLEEVMAATALTSLSTSPSVTFSSPGEIQKSMLNYGQGPELLLFRDTEATKPLWARGASLQVSEAKFSLAPLLHKAHLNRHGRRPWFISQAATAATAEGFIQVTFQCLGQRGGKVPSTASPSGMEKHIHLVHLQRQAEPEQSEGEEDYYYTELDVGVDIRADSGSPAVSTPLTFAHMELFPTCHSPCVSIPQAQLFSCSTGMPVTKPTSKVRPQMDIGGRSQSALERYNRGCGSFQSWWAPIHLEPQPTEAQAYIPALPAELGDNPRKPWGDAKECQKVYCRDHRNLWCTACQRFLD
ncbi:SLC2A4 regulator [Alexandromys fortis]|uniref:SLC2A4 regulator n=1 Tax=Alexandromys fortis TaxID=100897 RepID=UPI002152E671|nr:SLC2A4 regulator [Microtus fortis]